MKGNQMAKQNEGAKGAENIETESPYITEEASKKSPKEWFKSKTAKVTGIAVAGVLALGAAFASGAVAGHVASHNDGPSFGSQNFGHGDGDGPKGFGHDKPGFDRDGDHKFDGGQTGMSGNGQVPPQGDDKMPPAPNGDKAPAPITNP
jgi:hypothetical protein